MLDIKHCLITANKAARAAGQFLKLNFGKKHTAEFKSAHDVVLKADKQSEEIILKTITESFPDHNFYSEESGEINSGSNYSWFIDPLDGTNNFYAGIAYFGVSIALKYCGDIIAGVVYNPITDQMFQASKGNGATVNGTKISPSANEDINKSVVSFIKGHGTFDGGRLEESSKELEEFLEPKFRRMLKMWAPALDWCLLASGGIDAVISYESELEDQYAGTLIAQEAGASVVGFNGEKYDTSVLKILATNSKLKPDFLSLLKDFA